MENQNFEIMKKTPDGIIILHMSTIKNNHTMYGSWDMRCDRQNYFVILDQLLSFYPSNNPKNQNFQEMKKTPEDIFILKKYIKNYDHILHCSWDKACDRCNFHFSFWAIFCPFTPLTSQKLKISSFYTCVLKNYDHMMCSSWDMMCNRKTDEQTEKVKYWGGCCRKRRNVFMK